MTDMKALLREAAAEIRASVEAEYGHSLQYPSYRLNYDAGMELPAQLEAAAEGLGEPVAWLVQHPKWMPEPCVEIADALQHAPDIMEREKAQGWNFTPLYTAGTGVDSDQDTVQFTAYLEGLLEVERDRLAAAEAMPAVPEGFVLVPVEPTEAMLKALLKGARIRSYNNRKGMNVYEWSYVQEGWDAMLAALKEHSHD